VILDVLSAEGPLGEKSIVSAAEDAKISDGIRAAEGVGLDVVELEEGAGAAASAIDTDEGAALAVALEDRAADCARDGPAVGRRRRPLPLVRGRDLLRRERRRTGLPSCGTGR